MDAYASLYNFSVGNFRAQLRDAIANNFNLYEWNPANNNITYSQSSANGFITYTVNPSTLDTVTLGSTIVTWVTGTPTGLQVKIGTTLASSIANFVTFANASLDSQISQCTYSGSGGTVLNIVYKTRGLAGNAFPIAAAGSSLTVSGATLTGGGGLLTLTASVAAIEQFNGTYFYDVRWENGPTIAVLFGGTIVFVEGVTRDATVFG
jgi:hypothetical protein